MNPSTELSYIAQSNDGISWTLASSLGSGEFQPIQASVPAVVTRGNEVYEYAVNVASNNQLEVVVFSATSGQQLRQANISFPGFSTMQVIDPAPVVLPSGTIVLFFADTKTGCVSGTVAPVSDCISSATEVAGSDGTQFALDQGDRVVGAAQTQINVGPSLTDPSVYYDGANWVITAGSHTGSNGTISYVSPTPQGTYSLVGTTSSVQTPPAGYYDPVSSSYWIYQSTLGNMANVTIQRATSRSLASDLDASSFTTVASDASLGLPPTDVLHSSDFHVNTASSSATTTTAPNPTGSAAPPTSTATTLPAPPPPTGGPGYWMLDSGGTVYNFGSAANFGNATFAGGNAQAIVSTPDKKGLWVAKDRGQVVNLGDAPAMTLSGAQLPAGVAALARTPDGQGLWGVTAQGQVLTGGAAGDAVNFGSPANSGIALAKGIVGMAATPDGKGYWLLGGDGGVFAYGDAGFFGSTGNIALTKPAIAMTPVPDGKGYWFVASDGGIFGYGDAGFFGSMGATTLSKPVIGMVATADGKGYWLSASDGGVFAFGDAGFVGSLGGNPPANPIVGFTS